MFQGLKPLAIESTTYRSSEVFKYSEEISRDASSFTTYDPFVTLVELLKFRSEIVWILSIDSGLRQPTTACEL